MSYILRFSKLTWNYESNLTQTVPCFLSGAMDLFFAVRIATAAPTTLSRRASAVVQTKLTGRARRRRHEILGVLASQKAQPGASKPLESKFLRGSFPTIHLYTQGTAIEFKKIGTNHDSDNDSGKTSRRGGTETWDLLKNMSIPKPSGQRSIPAS